MATTFSGVIESFIKPEALAEFDKLGSKLEASLQGFDKMIAKAATLSTEISKGGQLYTQYISQTKQIADANKELQNSQSSINGNLSNYNKLLQQTTESIKNNSGASDSQAQRLIALRTELSKAKDAVEVYQKLIREVNKENPDKLSDKTFNEVFNNFGSETANSIKAAFDSLDSATKGDFILKLTEDAASFLAIQKELEQEVKAVASAINNQAKEVAASTGSIDQLGARLDGLQKAYRGLSEAERESEVGKNLKQQIDQLDPVVKSLEKSIGITRRLVGDYAGQLSPAFQVLNEQLKQNGALLQDTAKFTQLSADAQANLLAETAALEKLLKSNAVSVGDLKSQNIALQKTLIGLEEANLKGSESYKIIQAELVKGTKAVHDLRGEVKALTSDSRSLDQAIGVVSSLVAVYQTGAAAAELFGASTEDTQKSIAKLVAVQSVLNGLQTIQQQLTQRGTVLNRLYAFAQAQIAIATDASAAATVRLRAALVTTGFGALVVLVGFLAGKMIELANSTSDAAKSLEDLEKRLDKISDKFQYLNTILEQTNRIEIARLKSIGATDEQVFNAQQDGLRKRLQYLNDYQRTLGEEKAIFDQQNTKTVETTLPNGGRVFEAVINNSKEYLEGIKKIREKDVANELAINEVKTQIEVNKFSFDEQQRNKNLAARKKYIDDLNALSEKEARAQLDLLKFRKEQEIKLNEDVVGNSLNNINTRLAARERISTLQNEIVVAEYNFAIKYGKLTNSGLILQGEQRAAKEKEILENSLRDQLQLRSDYAKRFRDADAAIDAAFLDGNSSEKQIALLVDAYEKRRAIIQRNADDELTQLNNYRGAGLIAEEQYQFKRAQIEERTALAILQNELELAEKKMQILKQLGIDTIAVEEEIARIRKQISEKGTTQQSDNQKGSGKTPVDEVNELRDAWFNLGETLKTSVFAVLTRGFEQAKNDLQDQIDLIEERKTQEIDAVNATNASNQDKADRIKIIEATAAARRGELERKQRQIDQERARFERAAQAASIIGNTARAITAALPNVPLSIIAGAIGALQLATLYSTPIPKYLHGKKDNYQGWATVSEDGRPELYVDRERGIIGLTPAKPSMMYVSKDSQIIPAGQVNDFMRYSGISDVPQFQTTTSTAVHGGFNSNQGVVDAIRNKKMQQIVVVNNNLGWYDHVKSKVFK